MLAFQLLADTVHHDNPRHGPPPSKQATLPRYTLSPRCTSTHPSSRTVTILTRIVMSQLAAALRKLHEVIGKTVGEGRDKLIEERAVHADIFAART
jgi:hypothetical protein